MKEVNEEWAKIFGGQVSQLKATARPEALSWDCACWMPVWGQEGSNEMCYWRAARTGICKAFLAMVKNLDFYCEGNYWRVNGKK